MKSYLVKIMFVIFSLMFTNLARADAYATVQITSLGMKDTGNYIIVYAHYVADGWQIEQCSPTGWYWWIPNMTHMFWIPNTNSQMYSFLLTLAANKSNAFINAKSETLQYNTPVNCKITDITSR